jgi:hypothetical protein
MKTKQQLEQIIECSKLRADEREISDKKYSPMITTTIVFGFITIVLVAVVYFWLRGVGISK